MHNPEILGLFSEALDRPLFKAATAAADKLGVPVFVIGGFVRDVILGRPGNDIDFTVVGSGEAFANLLAEELGVKGAIHVYQNFGTAHFTYGPCQIEIVGARKESYRKNSRKPLVENGSLEDDQLRRDFTINAMAIRLNSGHFGMWQDPFSGLKDLAGGIIRTPRDPDVTYSDDPLRIMRAIRFACQLGFTIEEKSYLAIRKNAHRLGIVSVERITDELNKIILAPKPSAGFMMMDETGVLEKIFPRFVALKGAEYVDGKGHKDNFLHTLEVLDKLALGSDNLWLRWAALLHDIAKPVTKRFDAGTGWTFHGHEFRGAKMVPLIFRDMKLPMNEKMRYVQKMVLLHLRPIVLAEAEVTDSAVRRLLFDAGDDIDDLMMLCEADITSKNPEKVRRYLANFQIVRQKLVEIEEKDRLRNWQPPVSGDLIMETFGIPPSVEVGIIKTAIREAILDGIIPNAFEAAYGLMIEEGRKLGLSKKN